MTPIRSLAPAALAALALALTLPVAATAQAKGLKVGDKAPTAIAQTLDGAPVDLAQYIGKGPVVIEFWATWCPLCRRMEPKFKALDAKYGKDLTLLFVVVPTNQTPERAREYVTRTGHPGTFVYDADGSVYKAFAAYHTSYILVLDRNGTVLYSADGGDQDIDGAVRQAVGR